MLHKRIGIAGGGQLGKMLCQHASKWNLKTYVLDQSANAPAAPYCHTFIPGKFSEEEDVMRFAPLVDIVTVEIETVNTRALERLSGAGLEVHPHPKALSTIKDKSKQRAFYKAHGYPQPDFDQFESAVAVRDAVDNGDIQIPFVQKSATGGYDGRGVHIVKSRDDLNGLLEGRCIAEQYVDIDMEIGIIAVRNAKGEIAVFDPVEMVFSPIANLVDYLVCPARIEPKVAREATDLAASLISSFDICGLLAVELFLDKQGKLWVNEVAPRPHNSGHHTIESAYTSQFEQHIRAITGMPLGAPGQMSPAVMVNILGAEGHQGPVVYQGIEDVLKIGGSHIHLYGKDITKPWRKMGHITVVDDDIDRCIEKARLIQSSLKVVSNQ